MPKSRHVWLPILLLWSAGALPVDPFPRGGTPMTERPDSRRYFSKFYRGFTLQQTEQGWVILNFPRWASDGPVTPGPFGTEGIARHQVGRLLDSQRGAR